MGCGYGVMVVLLAGGLGLLGLASNRYDKAGQRPVAAAIVPGILGVLLVLGSGAYLKVARRLVQESAAEDARRAHPRALLHPGGLPRDRRPRQPQRGGVAARG